MEMPIVDFSENARKAIRNIAAYIEENGYPETAGIFAEQLFDFGDSLAIFPSKYPVCRKKYWAKRHWRCAPFKGYIFVYKNLKHKLIIYLVVHSRKVR